MTARPRGQPPLVGRQESLRVLEQALKSTSAGAFSFVPLVGDPGTGKTRLLDELTTRARRGGLTVLAGRAAEFEQGLPFGVVVDALDDHLEDNRPEGPGLNVLASVFPALAAHGQGEGEVDADLTGLGRYRLYRAVRQLLDELSGAKGVVLILDDVHWADDTSIELLNHLVRHPTRCGVLIAVAYRPVQAPPTLATLVDIAGEHGHRISVQPLTEPDVEELLGPRVSRTRCKTLFEASGGNPFYLEALARMGAEPVVGGDGAGELPAAVRAVLQLELTGLSPSALRVAQAAALTSDEFEPALAAVAAGLSQDAVLEALDELGSRDVVRPAQTAGRFRFRHPLVRQAAYGSAAHGWRVGVHARIAAHLGEVGAPATVRARHVERCGQFGDQNAVSILVDAARSVAAKAPAAAAHWLAAALRLMPDDQDAKLELLLELAKAQAVSGQLMEGRDSAREVLRLLPATDYGRRARAARLCALMERQLDRPHEGRALLLSELRQMHDPQSAAAVTMRLRLVAESMMRGDHRAAQAVLDLVPDTAPGWEPSLEVAVAALRPMPAYIAGRIGDAIRYIEAADRRMATAPDDHLADWMDAVAWLCWTETMLGRHEAALGRFERSLAVARATGQGYIVSNLLAGLARTYGMLGRLAEATIAGEEAVEVARLLGSGHQLIFALPQRSLVAAWSGQEEAALRFSEEALATGAGQGEWTGAMARYAQGVTLISAGQLDAGAEAVLESCDRFRSPILDQWTLLSCCEVMAQVEAARGNAEEAAEWAQRADRTSLPGVQGNIGLAKLAHAHALCGSDPARAAANAREAADMFVTARLPIHAGRARLRAGMAFAESEDRGAALTELRAAADLFDGCDARTLHQQAIQEQRRLGVRVPTSRARKSGPYGLSPRELEVAALVSEGHTNQQIAQRLFLSVRTVETHLSHIFAKVGATSRVGVVNALAEHASGGGEAGM